MCLDDLFVDQVLDNFNISVENVSQIFWWDFIIEHFPDSCWSNVLDQYIQDPEIPIFFRYYGSILCHFKLQAAKENQTFVLWNLKVVCVWISNHHRCFCQFEKNVYLKYLIYYINRLLVHMVYWRYTKTRDMSSRRIITLTQFLWEFLVENFKKVILIFYNHQHDYYEINLTKKSKFSQLAYFHTREPAWVFLLK